MTTKQPGGAKGGPMHRVAHLVEETARHCGHLDLLLEGIDGVAGE